MLVLSLGAGVQSTTLALMAAVGEVPRPACAIFADTGWEPKAVYEHLAKLEKALPFPIYRVSGGNIRNDIVARNTTTTGSFVSVPWHTLDSRGRIGMGLRQCTDYYKLRPIKRKIRELLGGKVKGRMREGAATVMLGISTDEAHRIKPSKVKFIQNVWPLIDKGMSRKDCKNWLAAVGWTAPKSACIGCPFHGQEYWRNLRDHYPEEWRDAVEIDRIIRAGGLPRGLRVHQFAHYACVPLDKANLSASDETPDRFGNECSGLCSV